jgi:hypothetical protein
MRPEMIAENKRLSKLSDEEQISASQIEVTTN